MATPSGPRAEFLAWLFSLPVRAWGAILRLAGWRP
jgi:hypothetical protein